MWIVFHEGGCGCMMVVFLEGGLANVISDEGDTSGGWSFEGNFMVVVSPESDLYLRWSFIGVVL